MEKILLTILLRIILVRVVDGDQGGDSRALLALKEGVGGRMQTWNSSVSPCNWQGIQCQKSRVVSVSLPAAELSGQIPQGSLGNLTELRKLRLRFNALHGSIPSDLSNCKQLRTLYLQNNRFTGPLPADFTVWPNLSRLNLAHNNFSGPLPDSLQSLKRLGTLYLENNALTGPLPPLDLPKLVYFNVSYNNLTGPVPDSLRNFSSDSFLGNNLNLNLSSKPKNKTKLGMIIGIAVGVTVVFIIGVLIVIRRTHKTTAGNGNGYGETPKKSGERDEKQRADEIDSSYNKDEYSISVQEPERPINNRLVFFPSSRHAFSLEDMLRASAELLGRGNVGTVYKAVLEVGSVVAVKRMKDVVIGPRDFAHQIEALGNISHPNLVALKAYYYSKEEKLLVYDYMPMGSLSTVLHGNRGAERTPLDWNTRVHIALGAAMGIEYLHKQGRKVSHGNIKSSNILVTENYDARVSDFGLVQMMSDEIKIEGYRAPEVTDVRKASQQADVYSFGVLVLELLTGKAPMSDQGVDLPRWVQSVVREEWTAEVFDMELIRYQQSMDEEEMLQLLQVGMACVAQFPDQRPTMSQVVKMIPDISHRSPKQLKSGDESS